ncbi:MAG TPA: hypothetical protein VES20_11380 [Bryobacteraceae bacterium]|nr:hypothetical protein [Bryobacteraceae bacterium]
MRAAGVLFTALIASAAVLHAQASSGAESVSVAPEWDVRAHLNDLVRDVAGYESLLRRMDVDHWIGRGAPEVYRRQLMSAQEAFQHLSAATDKLARQPELLSAAIEVMFQLERMELLVGSLRDGARKWQSEEFANTVTTAMAANTSHRERLRQHIRDVAVVREQEFQIANQEAQRCRGMLTNPVPAPPAERRSGRTRNRLPR